MSTVQLIRNSYISDKYIVVTHKETPYYDIFVIVITISERWSVVRGL